MLASELGTGRLFYAHLQPTPLAFEHDKIGLIKNGGITELDHSPCFYCSKYFKKLDWIESYRDSPWAKDHALTKGRHK